MPLTPIDGDDALARDGNGFLGSLPATMPDSLQALSFNINNFTGAVPAAFCSTRRQDCRIGGDVSARAPAVVAARDTPRHERHPNATQHHATPRHAPHHTRRDAQVDLDPYQANYPWILPVSATAAHARGGSRVARSRAPVRSTQVAGNVYDCPVPACAAAGGWCNSSHDSGKDQANSPVRCR